MKNIREIKYRRSRTRLPKKIHVDTIHQAEPVVVDPSPEISPPDLAVLPTQDAPLIVPESTIQEVKNCVCVIHGDAYDWQYVERLYNMLTRNSTKPIRLNVFTEKDRAVPDHMVRHDLQEWPGVHGPKRAWWYKMQMFDPARLQGQVWYFDLDVVITGNIDWLWALSSPYFWTLRDFKYLYRRNWTGINSSIMSWCVDAYAGIWHEFQRHDLRAIMRRFRGDQDFLTHVLPASDVKFIDPDLVKSYRWQIKEGGMDFVNRKYQRPGAPSSIDPATRILIFHGEPKPHQIDDDDLVLQHWI